MALSRAARLVVSLAAVGLAGPVTTLVAAPPASATAAPARATTGSAWTELGPTSSAFEYNGIQTTHSSSGRVTKVRPDPSNPARVYVATAGGGIWKTPDITVATPTWVPLTDGQPSLATGALGIDPSNSATLYAGLGETYDGLSAAGGYGPGAVMKSVDGGATWGSPVLLTAIISASSVTAQSVRDIAVDPHNSQVVLVATDIGLFRSTDSGASYAHVDLSGQTAPAQTYALSYVGASGGVSTWLVSGANAGTSPLDVDVTHYGDIWRSADNGVTWTSLRTTAKLPTAASLGKEFGRIALSTAPSESAPTTATTYAVVASQNGGDSTLAVFKSTNGGQTFTTVATGTTVTTNPPTNHNCSNMNVGHDNSYYSLAISVDPGNPDNVLVGGDLCTYRTTDGGTSWHVAGNWFPESGGTTAHGVLPYVGEYAQDLALVDAASGVRAVVGSAGGLGLGTNVFAGDNPESVTWTAPNTGLGTFQFSSVAAGDSADGDAGVVFGATPEGLRFHAPGTVGSFDQVVGGYVTGTSVGRTSGGATVYWGGTLGGVALYCSATADPGFCDAAGGHWLTAPTWANGTTDPVSNIKYSPIPSDANGRQLTSSTYDVFTVSSASPSSLAVNLSPSHFLVSATKMPIRSVEASQFPAGGHEFIGVALGGGHAAVGDFNGATATWTVGSAQLPLSELSGTAFPRHATSLGGSTDGQTYLVSSAAAFEADGSTVPTSVGHLFLTTDAGAHWTSFHGNGTADLPNVPVRRVLFDPLDDTDSTMYAGTASGVYVTADTGATWHRLGTGLPHATVSDIWLSPDGKTMDVATYGRGIWELPLHQSTTTTLTSDKPSPKDLQSVQLTATIAPSDAGGTVDFTDGGVSIGSATVSGGTATLNTAALSPGTHELQATYGGDQTHDGSLGSLNLVVPALQSVTVSPSPATLTDGHTKQLTATAHYSDSSTSDVTGSVTWISDKPAIAAVSGTGLLSGVAPGTALVTATATGSDGPHAGATTVTVTGVPTVKVGSLPVATLASSVSVTFSGSEAFGQITSYDVRYRIAGPTSTGWSAWSSTTRVTAKRVSMSIALGKSRCAQVRSRDAAGTTSAWSSPACTARALDDGSLAASSGWQRVAGSAFYGGHIRVAKQAGRTLTLKGTHVDRVGVVVTRCAGCGKLDVLLNGKVFKTVSLSAATTHNRVLVMLPRFSYRAATIVLRTRSASPVKVDGLVATRI